MLSGQGLISLETWCATAILVKLALEGAIRHAPTVFGEPCMFVGLDDHCLESMSRVRVAGHEACGHSKGGHATLQDTCVSCMGVVEGWELSNCALGAERLHSSNPKLGITFQQGI